MPLSAQCVGKAKCRGRRPVSWPEGVNHKKDSHTAAPPPIVFTTACIDAIQP
ncbi:hypothetical protein PA08_0630 [Cutibacterium modestum P08]|uniref:Uncharacterized protein n=1 Tax=Cutibacterium modestum HL044PA1 TaxID=765109 RepID=A0ABP2K7H6_9ACTN|nr:hypothetical protein HMPREF9621_01232 [Cutibacterium modestum HL037PA2]EFS91939.1 hypothetical protein HMPREF9607_01805 [Cutibacterium modestum HL044PA1]EGG27364.1 hypothetical protein PA08_0630 [Cutibacterium modestum P08]